MMRHLYIAFLLSVLMLPAMAQRGKKDTTNYDCRKGQYISASIGGGLQTLAYNAGGYADRKPGLGINAKAMYQYFLTPNLGLSAGLGVYTHKSRSVSTFLETIPDAVDEAGKPYHHRTYFSDMEEVQRYGSLEIPFGVCYQRDIIRKLKAFGTVGFAASVPLYAKYKVDDGGLETRAYYPGPKLELFGMAYHNEYQRSGFDGKYNFGTVFSAFANVGAMYALSAKLDALAQIDLAINLGKLNKAADSYLYDPDCRAADAYQNPKYNGILGSYASGTPRGLAVGLSVGIRYRIGDIPQRPIPEKPDEPRQPETDTTEQLLVDVPVDIPVDVVDSIPDTDTTMLIVDDGIEVIEIPDTIQTNDDQYQLGLIYFDFNKAIDPAMEMDLNKFAKFMRTHPDMELEIVGHTDNVGSRESNTVLGLQRAEYIRDEFVNRGVEPSRIKCVSKWFSEPLVPNTSEENRAKNRRVELIVRWK